MATEQTKPQTPPADPSQTQPSQPSARELELQAQIEQLKQRNQELESLPTDQQAAAAQKVEKGYKVPKGEEGYTHVLETQVNGEAIEPRVRAYDPHQYSTLISKQQGYTGKVIHKGKE